MTVELPVLPCVPAHPALLLFGSWTTERMVLPTVGSVNASCCAGLALTLGLVIHASCLHLGYPVSPLLSGQDRALLERITLELR